MKFATIYIFAIVIGLFSSDLLSATAATNQSHSHDGRFHFHALPKAGIKHYHKHMHKGRAHIHPYSAKVGFKHTHNNPRSKAWENAVKHNHGGRAHSHPLPTIGVKHQHKHKHGERTHIHPLPINGAEHYHQKNVIRSNQRAADNTWITGLSIKQQMAAVLNTPLARLPDAKEKSEIAMSSSVISNSVMSNSILTELKASSQKQVEQITEKKNKPTLNQDTINKVLGYRPNKKTIQTIPSALKIQNKVTRKKLITVKPRPISRAINTISSKSRTPKQVAESKRQFELALRYENGTGIKKNLQQAVNWYLRSAKNGNRKAQLNLAILYEKGEGISRNIPQAMRWYTTAANNGDVNAQVSLGNRYVEGSGVPKNIKEAARLYKRAADQGDIRGRANLNYLIENYNGILKR